MYASALAALRSEGRVYVCECTRSDIEAASDRAGDELRYPGTCAAKSLDERAGRGVRVRLPPSAERFMDLRHGPQEQRPSAQCGDLLVRDRHGNWTYQFVATVDDREQGVTLVIRGDDLLSSTGRQTQLARLLGRGEPPRFLHHPLVMKSAAQKLSKSDGDTGIRDLRARGWAAAELIGEAAALAGLADARRPLAVAELAHLPELSRLGLAARAQIVGVENRAGEAPALG